MSLITKQRAEFHKSILGPILRTDKNGVPGNADSSSKASIAIAKGIIDQIQTSQKTVLGERLAGQKAGAMFENTCHEFLKNTFLALKHLRPGCWNIEKGHNIALYDQYNHLDELEKIAGNNPELRTALGSDYVIKPDVVIYRSPEPDEEINSGSGANLVDEQSACATSIRLANNESPVLHASVSCKWTLRSDRAQNARSEGLNLVKNRKGRLPHIAVVTGEPTPNRIASIALGLSLIHI